MSGSSASLLPLARRAAVALLLVVLLHAPGARAQGQGFTPQLEGRALIEALQKGGHVILLRHMATDPFVPDPDTVELEACKNQRNLSEVGREQARTIGRAVEALGIPIGEVLSSPYCRCLETGRLAFGKVTVSEALTVGDDLSPDEKDAQGARIRSLLADAPTDGTNTVLITHTGNLLYSFGLQVRPEGIAHVFRRSVVGTAAYVGMLLPEEWAAFAGIEETAHSAE